MGLEFNSLTETEVVDHVTGELAAGRGGWIVTPNLDILRMHTQDPEIQRLYTGADLVVADGMPLVWASRCQRTPLPGRVPGSGLISSLSAGVARVGASVFLLGGDPGTADGAADLLVEANPGLRVAGTNCPPRGFDQDSAQLQAITAELTATAPDVVFVGLPTPMQDKLITRLRDSFPQTWFIGVGVSFSFLTGEVNRAPGWMQRVGLEWVHRLLQEPRRLFRRYIVDDLPFAVRLFGSALRRRVAASDAR
jgi:N-acetylglucosaminyldiphosphoundecaprenol N-acetyl-beta-D-mannosaminyltransferase